MAVLRCTEPFAFSDHKTGVQRVVRLGDLVDSKDPLIKGREQWFETVDATAERFSNRTVEQATSAPGEKRSVRRGRPPKSTEPDVDDTKTDDAGAV